MKNKKIFIMIISIITVISFVIGFSYAYFTTIVIGNDTASSNTVTVGTIQITYNGTDFISLENAEPGATDNMTFTVTNTGLLSVSSYDIYLSKLLNSFINDEVVYDIECVSSDAVPCSGTIETPIPTTEALSLTQGSIAPGTTHTYTLTVEFIDTGLPQNYNQEKELSFTVSINDTLYLPASLVNATYVYDPINSTVGYFWDYKEDITSVTFEDEVNIPIGAIESWDVTEEQNGKIIAYIIDDGLGMNTYELFIQSNQTIYANSNSNYWFMNFYNLVEIINLSSLNTSNVTSMSSLFDACNDLTSLDLSKFNTDNVANMSGLFMGCNNITSLDLSTFNTTNVWTMTAFFYACSSLTSLNLSTFNTTNVLSMGNMFAHCSNLVSLNLSTFNTANVEYFHSMFYNCNSLINLNLSSFSLNSMVDTSDMFYDCSDLSNIYS